MRKNQIKLLKYFKKDFSLLKQRGRSVKIVNEEIRNDERKEIKRSVYKWSLEKPILIFNKAEQIEFNDFRIHLIKKHLITSQTIIHDHNYQKWLILRRHRNKRQKSGCSDSKR